MVSPGFLSNSESIDYAAGLELSCDMVRGLSLERLDRLAQIRSIAISAQGSCDRTLSTTIREKSK